MAALLLGVAEKHALKDLRARAEAFPVDMLEVKELLKTPDGAQQHFQHMKAYTVEIPHGFVVTFTIEDRHPMGRVRHLSVSVRQVGRVASVPAIQMLAEELGFWGRIPEEAYHVWPEEIGNGSKAINLVQQMQRPTLQ